jgi:hypothetical protein
MWVFFLSALCAKVFGPRTFFEEALYLTVLKSTLKAPKCEIFDRSDFPDFYTINSLRVGDFGVK